MPDDTLSHEVRARVDDEMDEAIETLRTSGPVKSTRAEVIRELLRRGLDDLESDDGATKTGGFS